MPFQSAGIITRPIRIAPVVRRDSTAMQTATDYYETHGSCDPLLSATGMAPSRAGELRGYRPKCRHCWVTD